MSLSELGRLHNLATYVLSTRIRLHGIELINKTLVNDDFLKIDLNSLFFIAKIQSSENFNFRSYQNKNL